MRLKVGQIYAWLTRNSLKKGWTFQEEVCLVEEDEKKWVVLRNPDNDDLMFSSIIMKSRFDKLEFTDIILDAQTKPD